MTICLSNIIYRRHQQLSSNSNSNGIFASCCNVPTFMFIIFLACHILFSSIYYFAYGFMAYIFGFFNTWSYLLYLILRFMSVNLSPASFPETVRLKYSKKETCDNETDQESNNSVQTPILRSSRC